MGWLHNHAFFITASEPSPTLFLLHSSSLRTTTTFNQIRSEVWFAFYAFGNLDTLNDAKFNITRYLIYSQQASFYVPFLLSQTQYLPIVPAAAFQSRLQAESRILYLAWCVSDHYAGLDLQICLAAGKWPPSISASPFAGSDPLLLLCTRYLWMDGNSSGTVKLLLYMFPRQDVVGWYIITHVQHWIVSVNCFAHASVKRPYCSLSPSTYIHRLRQVTSRGDCHSFNSTQPQCPIPRKRGHWI